MLTQMLTAMVSLSCGLGTYAAHAESLPRAAVEFITAEQTRITSGSADPHKLKARTNDMPTVFRADAQTVFTLESYWVSEAEFRGIVGYGLSPELKKLFVRNHHGHMEFRLLVHPLSIELYAPLMKHAERAEDFLATATASNRSLVAWLPGHEHLPFIAKVSLAAQIGGTDRTIKSVEIARSLGTNNLLQSAREELPQSFHFMPETFGIYPLGVERGGMILREFPRDAIFNHATYVPLFALYGGTAQAPLMLSMIERSGLSPLEFVRSKIVRPFVAQWLDLVLKHGINMETHGQNVLIALGPDGLPNGHFVHRDFGGFRLDLAYRKKIHEVVPEDLPRVTTIESDYHQKFFGPSLRVAMGRYFEGSFLWDLEQHMIQWQSQGLLQNATPITEGSITQLLWTSLELEYELQTGLHVSIPQKRFTSSFEGATEAFAELIETGRNHLTTGPAKCDDMIRGKRSGAILH